MRRQYGRALLKLSGEALAGERGFGLDYRVAEAAIALEDFRVKWPDENPHETTLARMYAVLGKTDEAMALSLAAKAYLAAELGQRDTALSAMEEEAAKRADPHDRRAPRL